MAKFSESEKKRLSSYYNQVLFNLFTEEKITEEDMEELIDDLDLLNNLCSSKTWNDLIFFYNRFSPTPEELTEFFEKTILKNLSSPIIKKWVKIHLENKHFPILNKNVKDSEKYVVKFFIDVPEFIDISDKRYSKLKNMVRKYYQEKLLDEKKNKFVKVYVNPLPKNEGSETLVSDDKFKSVANSLFDLEVELIEKNLFKN